MKREEREEWIQKVRNKLEKQSDDLFTLETFGKKDTSAYRRLFREFWDTLQQYEEASKRHEELKRQEEKGPSFRQISDKKEGE